MASSKVHVCVLGVTGTGKSATCNTLAQLKEDDPDAFPVSEKIQSCTYLTTAKTVSWFDNDGEFTLVDTPGLGDSEGRDTIHINDMAKKLKEIGYINAFLIVFNGQHPRMDEHLQAILKNFTHIFGRDFLHNAVFVFTRWAYDVPAIRKRQRNGESENGLENEFNEHFGKEFGIGQRIPATFIDNYPYEEDEDEMRQFYNQLTKLKSIVTQMKPYCCLDVQAVKGIKDEMEDKLQAEKERADELDHNLEKETQRADLLGKQLKKENIDTNIRIAQTTIEGVGVFGKIGRSIVELFVKK